MTDQIETDTRAMNPNRRAGFAVKLVRFFRSLGQLWAEVSTGLNQQVASELDRSRFNDALEAYLQESGKHGLQIGAGEFPLEGWFNTDIEPSVSMVYSMDASKPFAIPDNSFDYVYSEHMIEHIPFKHALAMLNECFRVLKPGGVIRVATPDLMQFIRLFNQAKSAEETDYLSWSLNEQFGLYSQDASEFQRRKSLWQIDSRFFTTHLPNAIDDGASLVLNLFMHSYGHQFIFDEKTLRAALAGSGFVDIRRVAIGESPVDDLTGIEHHSGRAGEAPNQFETMVLEAERPSAAAGSISVEASTITHSQIKKQAVGADPGA